MLPVVTLARPAQWVKNLLVFMPMFFGGRLFDVECWLMSAMVFVAFSLAGSAVYCLNDVIDREADRLHPVKRKRPVAYGLVSPRVALCVSAGLAIAALVAGFVAGIDAGLILAAYMLLNAGYCLWLKNIPVADVFCIALGFVLRVEGGGVACTIELSPWIICVTFLLALFLAFAKRREDVGLFAREGVAVRKTASSYTVEFLNIMLAVTGAATMLCYILYTISPEVVARFGCRYIYVTSLFVLAGLMRYLLLVVSGGNVGNPVALLLHDRFLQVCIVLWIVVFGIMIY